MNESTPPTPRLQKYGKGKRWATWWQAEDGPHFKSFGHFPEVQKREAEKRYQFWLDSQWKVKPHVRAPQGQAALYTVTRLAADYLRYARKTFVKHGKPTSHVWNIRMAMRSVAAEWGPRSSSDIEAKDLAALRDKMVWRTVESAGVEKVVPRARKTVNYRLKIVVQAFEHAREHGRVPANVVADLRIVKRLKKGRTEAKPSKRVKSVKREVLNQVLAVVPKPVKAILDLLSFTGMRPSEPCIMRGADLVTASTDAPGLWEYRPSRHKLEHMGDDGADSERVIFLGVQAQEVIKPFLATDTQAYLFSPAAAQAERLAIKRSMLKTPSPCRLKRYKADPTAKLGDHYTAETLRRSVLYACKKTGAPRFTPNQIRHLAATELEKKFGRAGSRVVLGHASERTTSIYVDPDVQMAMRIAREVG